MSDQKHPTDIFFKEGLNNLEITPPEGVWNAVEKNLNQRKKRVILWYRLGWAAGIILFITVGSTLYLTDHSKHNNTIISNHSNTISADTKSETTVVSTKNPVNNETSNTLTSKIHGNKKPYFNSHPENPEITENSQNSSKSNKNDIYLISSAYSNTHEEKLQMLQPKLEVISADPKYSLKEIITMDNRDTANWIQPDDNKNIAKESFFRRNHLSIEGALAPTYAFRAISNTANNDPSSLKYNSNESALIAWSGGFKINYKYNQRWSFQFGLYYSVMGQVINNVYAISNSTNKLSSGLMQQNRLLINIENSLGTINNSPNNGQIEYNNRDNSDYYNLYNNIDGNVIQPTYINSSYTKLYGNSYEEKLDAKIIQKLHYIEFPILIRYRIIDKKLTLHLIAGSNTSILLSANATLKTNTSHEELSQSNNLKKINYNVISGFGFTFPLKNNIHFIFEPTLKYNIYSAINNPNRNVHLYSYNLYTGFSINF